MTRWFSCCRDRPENERCGEIESKPLNEAHITTQGAPIARFRSEKDGWQRRVAPLICRTCGPRGAARPSRAESGSTSQIASVGRRSNYGRLPDEADLPAESDSSETKSRIPRENEYAWRPSHLEAPPGKGPEAPRSRHSVEIAMTPPTGRFPRADRILHSNDFRRVGRLGNRRATRHFVVLVEKRDGLAEAHSRRLGVTVSRRVGNAVVRNRIKRGIREWFRRNRESLEAPANYVVIARRQAAILSSGEVGEVLNEMVRGRGGKPCG